MSPLPAYVTRLLDVGAISLRPRGLITEREKGRKGDKERGRDGEEQRRERRTDIYAYVYMERERDQTN